ncbi:MAG: insulinase family protein, partial [candidate division KSB1 bacterium]|nr:insulinase family protein [candidate division KSB1 bacterium]
MRRHILLLAISVLMGLLLAGMALAQKGPKEPFAFPPLHKIEMPSVQKAELKNGMKLYLVEDHQYPTIDLRAMVGVGSIYEPADKIGLASITGTVLRTGGTETRTGDEIDELLETLGASVETSIGQGSGYVSVSVLKEDIDKGIDILADILMHPAFRQEKIDLAKIEARSMISRRNDDVWDITSREFNSLIYGKTHPYARYPEYATIDAITRDDIVAFYKKYFYPNNIIFAAWGDFKAKDMKKKLETAFARWPAAKIDFPPKPKVDYQYKYTVNFVQKSDLNQTHIQMGHIGGLMNDPDYPALTIMNQILSYDRMFKVIRTQEGLTYAPWGYFGAEYDHPGVFNCGTQTKSQSTVYAIRLMLKEVKRMTEEEVTDEELTRAKDTYLNGFVFNFDSRAKIVNRMMTYAYYNYPLDFIDRIKEAVEKVTKADVLRVARKYLHPDKLQILVVGKKEDFDEPLSVLGPVNEIDITIPEPKGEAVPAATPESLEKGKNFLNKVIQACGGLEAFRKIQNLWASLDLVQV